MGKISMLSERSMDFLDMVWDSTLRWTFKKLSLVEFWHNVKEKYPQWFQKAIKMFFLFSSISLWGQIFFIYFNQSITTWMEKKIQKSSFLLLDQILKRFAKMKNNAIPLVHFLKFEYSDFSLKHMMLVCNRFIINIFLRFYLFISERGREGEREGEKHQCVRETSISCLSCTTNRGLGPKPRHVPWLGIELATLWFT